MTNNILRYHESVMGKEIIEALKIIDNGIYVDTTLGGGGHTKMMLEANDTIKVIAFDKDKDAIDYNSGLPEQYPLHRPQTSENSRNKYGDDNNRLKIFNDNFVNFRSRLALERISEIDGILFDLGVSKHQIATASRGLSFDLDGSLDMRMNRDDELTAADIINKYPVKKIEQIIREFGEEREARRIAMGIDNHRKYSPIKTTYQLAEIIDKSCMSPFKIKAKARVFQALRIYLNGELEVLKSALYDAVETIKPGGRIVVLSYHSLEDRIVKQIFVEETKDCVCPPKFPECVCDKQARLRIITKKPVLPSQEEIEANRSAKSAKMRVAEGIEFS